MDKCEAALNGRAFQGPWTYAEMRAIAGTYGGIVDKIHQRWRKNGWATFTRHGRNIFWTLTDAGRKALADG